MKSVKYRSWPGLVKVIVETCYLDDRLKRLVCKIVVDVGADFIKTSTGKGPSGATAAMVELFRDLLPEGVGVKAAAGLSRSRTLK
jgi:deoxyribose-phosphate aldolase